MKISQHSLFTYWELSDEEVTSGSILSAEQYALIQNDISELAHRQVALKFEPTNPVKFAQEQADLAGEIVALKNILMRSDKVVSELQEIITSQEERASNNQEYQQEEITTSSLLSDIFAVNNPQN